jgi:glycosyltransferase involved in cell wall biosynthesis
MIINWYSSFSQGQGYSGSSEHMVVALSKKGVDVRTVGFNRQKKKNYTSDGLGIKRKPFALGDIGLAYGFPNCFNSIVNKIKIGFTMFETDKLPNGNANDWSGASGNWLDMIKNLDLLLAPSNFCKELFINQGAKIPVEVVPLGVNTEMYKYIERPKRKTFTFLMLGTLTIRKNPGYVISAFLTLFKDNPNVKLVLKTQSGILGHLTFPYKNIEIIDRTATTEEMMEYYKEADCFVFPSRGEGFGLPPLEAMATGLPTIFSANTGMLDFADDKYGYPIRKMTKQPALHFSKKWGNVGNWFDPDYQEVKQLMKYVYENQDEAKAKGKLASDWVKNNWTYSQTSDKLIIIFNRLSQERR